MIQVKYEKNVIYFITFDCAAGFFYIFPLILGIAVFNGILFVL